MLSHLQLRVGRVVLQVAGVVQVEAQFLVVADAVLAGLVVTVMQLFIHGE
jgi:hypothetical protein